MRHVTAAALLLVACSRSEPIASDRSGPTAAAVVSAPATASTPNPLNVIMAKKTMADALVVAGPLMTDKPGDSSPGTFLFALWSLKNLRWQDVAVTRDETSAAKVRKDIDAERMKRLCVSGTIIQIEAFKQPYGTLYAGLMLNDAMNLYHFNAVRSTGELVQQSPGRFCGVVTGKYDYANSAGGEGHAIDMVGMFDLRENRTAR